VEHPFAALIVRHWWLTLLLAVALRSREMLLLFVLMSAAVIADSLVFNRPMQRKLVHTMLLCAAVTALVVGRWATDADTASLPVWLWRWSSAAASVTAGVLALCMVGAAVWHRRKAGCARAAKTDIAQGARP